MEVLKVLPLDKLQPGMVVAEDVFSSDGTHKLLGRGVQLDENTMLALRRRGVEWVAVKGELAGTDIDPAEQALVRREVQSKLDETFAKVSTIPHMAALKATVMNHLVEKQLYERKKHL
jgi:hypothetical protein